jgi:hypothetical protein
MRMFIETDQIYRIMYITETVLRNDCIYLIQANICKINWKNQY